MQHFLADYIISCRSRDLIHLHFLMIQSESRSLLKETIVRVAENWKRSIGRKKFGRIHLSDHHCTNTVLLSRQNQQHQSSKRVSRKHKQIQMCPEKNILSLVTVSALNQLVKGITNSRSRQIVSVQLIKQQMYRCTLHFTYLF